MEVKYPDIKVQLIGGSDNTFAILGTVKKGTSKGGHREGRTRSVYEGGNIW